MSTPFAVPDDDCTPYMIAGMSKLNGLSLVALTDHNTCGNVETFLAACTHYGLIGVPGMELTTAEDIHLICLFPDSASALRFDAAVRTCRIPVKNRPEIFGRQILIGADDEPVGEEPNLLINATSLSLCEGAALARSMGGAAYPAHIDREAIGILAVLGVIPDEPHFAAVELHDPSVDLPARGNRRMVAASDAHRLIDLPEQGFPLRLPVDGSEPKAVRRALIDYMEGR